MLEYLNWKNIVRILKKNEKHYLKRDIKYIQYKILFNEKQK